MANTDLDEVGFKKKKSQLRGKYHVNNNIGNIKIWTKVIQERNTALEIYIHKKGFLSSTSLQRKGWVGHK